MPLSITTEKKYCKTQHFRPQQVQKIRVLGVAPGGGSRTTTIITTTITTTTTTTTTTTATTTTTTTTTYVKMARQHRRHRPCLEYRKHVLLPGQWQQLLVEGSSNDKICALVIGVSTAHPRQATSIFCYHGLQQLHKAIMSKPLSGLSWPLEVCLEAKQK